MTRKPRKPLAQLLITTAQHEYLSQLSQIDDRPMCKVIKRLIDEAYRNIIERKTMINHINNQLSPNPKQPEKKPVQIEFAIRDRLKIVGAFHRENMSTMLGILIDDAYAKIERAKRQEPEIGI